MYLPVGNYAVRVVFRMHVASAVAFAGSDVDWVLAGTGSLSSGSARSHGQLIAAHRLDPQTTLFPKTDDKSAAAVKKGNPWTDRKEIVAFGVGVRAASAGQQQQQLAHVNPEKSSVSPRHFMLLFWLHNLRIVEYGLFFVFFSQQSAVISL
jgi:hypothetical protein